MDGKGWGVAGPSLQRHSPPATHAPHSGVLDAAASTPGSGRFVWVAWDGLIGSLPLGLSGIVCLAKFAITMVSEGGRGGRNGHGNVWFTGRGIITGWDEAAGQCSG